MIQQSSTEEEEVESRRRSNSKEMNGAREREEDCFPSPSPPPHPPRRINCRQRQTNALSTVTRIKHVYVIHHRPASGKAGSYGPGCWGKDVERPVRYHLSVLQNVNLTQQQSIFWNPMDVFMDFCNGVTKSPRGMVYRPNTRLSRNNFSVNLPCDGMVINPC